MTVQRARSDSGYTLVEVLVVMSLSAVLMAFAVWGLRSMQFANEQLGTTQSLTAYLRSVQERAMSEGRSYCVAFATDSTYRTYRLPETAAPGCGDSPVHVDGPRRPTGPTTAIIAPSFMQADGSQAPAVVFRPSGRATPGMLIVIRAGSGKTYQLRVEGLTGRVSQS